MQEKKHGTRQVCMQKNIKELVECIRKKSSMELGKCVRMKIVKDLASTFAKNEARN